MAQLVKVRSLCWEDPWRREQLPTPVFWPGEFQGPFSPWGHKESDMTEQLLLFIPLISNVIIICNNMLGRAFCFLFVSSTICSSSPFLHWLGLLSVPF